MMTRLENGTPNSENGIWKGQSEMQLPEEDLSERLFDFDFERTAWFTVCAQGYEAMPMAVPEGPKCRPVGLWKRQRVDR